MVYVALLGWIPVTLYMFARMGAQRAAITSLVLGYLLLPQAVIDLPGMVDITRTSSLGVGIVLGMLIFDPGRLRAIEFKAYDLPMAVWCVSPLATSLANGLGVYDGLSSVLATSLAYGIPYVVGRAYVRRSADLCMLGTAIVGGGVLYLALCWYEIRMSPQLHHLVYGFTQHDFAQTRRLGGWRPMVFLQHGLALGMWMTVAALIALGLWQSRRLARIGFLPPLLTVVALVVTAALCKSTGAIVLLIVGAFVIVLSLRMNLRAPAFILALLVPTFLIARIAFDWTPEVMIERARDLGEDRAASLAVRVEADQALLEHARERPWLGWGGWDRFRAGVGRTDSLWGITLGQRGLVGIISLFGTLVLAPLVALRRIGMSGEVASEHPEAVVLATVLGLYAVDCIMNAMFCPVFIAVAGGLSGWHPAMPARRRLHDGA